MFLKNLFVPIITEDYCENQIKHITFSVHPTSSESVYFIEA